MKQLKLIGASAPTLRAASSLSRSVRLVVLSLAALVFGRPAGFCTANTLSEDVAVLNDRLAKLEAENAALKAQPQAAPEAPDSTLTLLCKGAGVDITDVRWRMQAGLDGEQAVEAALAQKQHDGGGDKKAASAQSQK